MRKRLSAMLILALVLPLLTVCAVAETPSGNTDKQATSQKQPAKRDRAKKRKRKPNPAFALVTDDPHLPRVLLIGDSISIGYTVPVREALAGKANVHRIPMNGGDTARGLQRMEKWLGEKPWDVIHFNWGLHDLKRMKDGKYDVTGSRVRSPEDYAENLEKLVVRLKKTGAVLIWATTTPVPEGARGRIKGDEVLYNKVAAKVMAEHGVKVNDLFAFIMPKLAKAQRPRDVHFSNEGSKMLGRKAAEEIATALRDR